MGYVRFMITGCGAATSYQLGFNGRLLLEQVKCNPLKYSHSVVCESSMYVEQAWWKVVEFLAKHPGSRLCQLRSAITGGQFAVDSALTKLTCRTSDGRNNFKYYLNNLGIQMYNKYRYERIDDPEHVRRLKADQAKRKKEYDAAVIEANSWEMILRNRQHMEAIEALA